MRTADASIDEVHVTDFALILLLRRDLSRIRRPEENRSIAVHPSGVVGGVTEVLPAVCRELRLASARHVANPKVPVTNEGRSFRVGRHDRWSGGPAAAAPRP